MDLRPITVALDRAVRGEPGSQEALWKLVYQDLRLLAASRLRALQPGQTLQATALVHEAWLRLSEVHTPNWESRAHFFGSAARSMRNILVDRVRAARSQKRGEGANCEDLPDGLAAGVALEGLDLLALDEALDALAAEHERPSQIIMLRFFGGLAVEEIADVLTVATRTVERDLLFARTWLRRFMDGA